MSQAAGTRLAERTEEEIEKLVSRGFYMSRSAFIREAVRDKLASIRVIQLREDVSFQQAKREILEYLTQHEQAYPSEIADALRLDYGLVLKALEELRKSREAEPV